MRKFKLLYLAPVFALIALMAWALASPIGSAPDDDFHLASIWCANPADTAACLPGHKADERKVPAAVHFAPCYAFLPNRTAACQKVYYAMGSKPTVETDRGSFSNNYPPVYYAAMSVFVGKDIAGSALLMRLVNIVLLVGITTALVLLLPRRRRLPLVAGWVITAVPLGLFLVASNNPSSWALIGIGSAWAALLGYFETSGKKRIALGVIFALTVLMAAGARGDAALYSVLSVGIVFILTFRRSREFLYLAILPVVMSLVALYFFFSSQQSGVAVAGLRDSSQPAAAAGSPGTFSLILKNLINIPSLWTGSFGTWGLGWIDTALPVIVPFLTLIAFALVLFVGLAQRYRRKSIVLMIIGAALVFLPTYVLVKGGNEVGQNVQPRYLLPIIILGAGIALLGVAEERIRLSRTTLVVVIAALSIAEAISLFQNMRRYITGINSHNWNLDSNMGWWWNTPVPPMVVWVIGTVAFIALLTVLARETLKTNELA